MFERTRFLTNFQDHTVSNFLEWHINQRRTQHSHRHSWPCSNDSLCYSSSWKCITFMTTIAIIPLLTPEPSIVITSGSALATKQREWTCGLGLQDWSMTTSSWYASTLELMKARHWYYSNLLFRNYNFFQLFYPIVSNFLIVLTSTLLRTIPLFAGPYGFTMHEMCRLRLCTSTEMETAT